MEKLLEKLSEHSGFATPFMYAAGAYYFFHWLDEKLSDEAKAALARTMSFKDYKNEQVASALVEVFDRIYTYPLLSWRAFFRSLLFTSVVTAIWIYERDIAVREIVRSTVDWFDEDQGGPIISTSVLLVASFLVSFLFNSFTDYLSLFVIRPLLIRSGTRPVVRLALGAVSGTVIVVAASMLRIIAVIGGFHLWLSSQGLGELPLGIPPYLSISANTRFEAPALVVFLWLPLFALGIVTVRLLTPLSWIVGRTQWFLKEGKEHPLKAIGYVAAVVVFLCTATTRVVFSA